MQQDRDAPKSREGSKYIQGPKMNTPEFHAAVLYTPHVERTELASCAVCDAGIKEQTVCLYGRGPKKRRSLPSEIVPRDYRHTI
jgi:hypothetical protein